MPLLMTLSSLRLLLKMNVVYSFPLHLTSLTEHQVFSARTQTLFQGFSPRILTLFEVWIRPLRRCSMLTPGLENQCPPLHTSEANIKKNNLNQITVKRDQSRLLSSWVRRRKGGSGWITWNFWGRFNPVFRSHLWRSFLFSSWSIRLLIIQRAVPSATAIRLGAQGEEKLFAMANEAKIPMFVAVIRPQ